MTLRMFLQGLARTATGWSLLFLVGIPSAHAGLPETVERVKSSIVAIGTFQKTRSPPFVFRGTGFAIEDGTLSCAGGLAGLDLMLRLIDQDHGEGLVSEIADNLMHHQVRASTTPQRRTMGRSTDALPPMTRDAISLIEQNIVEPLSVPQIALTIGVSQRQLERQFKQAIGCTLVQFGLLLRLQHARGCQFQPKNAH